LRRSTNFHSEELGNSPTRHDPPLGFAGLRSQRARSEMEGGEANAFSDPTAIGSTVLSPSNRAIRDANARQYIPPPSIAGQRRAAHRRTRRNAGASQRMR
jgi:hypothetical protein